MPELKQIDSSRVDDILAAVANDGACIALDVLDVELCQRLMSDFNSGPPRYRVAVESQQSILAESVDDLAHFNVWSNFQRFQFFAYRAPAGIFGALA